MPRPYLIAKAQRLGRRLRALYIALNAQSPAERASFERRLALYDVVVDEDLALEIERLKGEVRRLEKLSGFRGDYLKLYALTEQPLPYILVRKNELDKLFATLGQVFPEHDLFPPHSRLGLDVAGQHPVAIGPETFILEASLFEDVAALWNIMLAPAQHERPAREVMKREAALKRAAAKATFNLVEAYVNGIASDVVETRNDLTPRERRLTEWDDEKNRPALVQLRDKLLKYPRIALRLEHPPLSEDDTPDLRFLLEMERSFRHALIHPTPLVRDSDTGALREELHLMIEHAQLKKLVMSALRLICSINETLNGMFGDVRYWLRFPADDGPFPDSSFS